MTLQFWPFGETSQVDALIVVSPRIIMTHLILTSEVPVIRFQTYRSLSYGKKIVEFNMHIPTGVKVVTLQAGS